MVELLKESCVNIVGTQQLNPTSAVICVGENHLFVLAAKLFNQRGEIAQLSFQIHHGVVFCGVK